MGTSSNGGTVIRTGRSGATSAATATIANWWKKNRGISIGSDRKFSYHYDAAGRLERVLATSEAGAERVYESYRYDAQGLKTVSFYPDRTPARGSVGVSVEAMLHWPGDAGGAIRQDFRNVYR
ncbi:MAG TPA: hypothetical protein VMT32_05715 [Bryobacteraceae bacterium]|nr:hypothetical protein [Bryobacteraceae bacterium]